jgi:hypothetical protein
MNKKLKAVAKKHRKYIKKQKEKTRVKTKQIKEVKVPVSAEVTSAVLPDAAGSDEQQDKIQKTASHEPVQMK